MAFDSATMAVLRSDDSNDDWGWGTARLKLDLVAILEVPKGVNACYLSVNVASMLRRREVERGGCGRAMRRPVGGAQLEA
jgi:hypothetical protein